MPLSKILSQKNSIKEKVKEIELEQIDSTQVNVKMNHE